MAEFSVLRLENIENRNTRNTRDTNLLNLNSNRNCQVSNYIENDILCYLIYLYLIESGEYHI